MGSKETELWQERTRQPNYADFKISLPLDFKIFDKKCEHCFQRKQLKIPLQSRNKASDAQERVFAIVVGLCVFKFLVAFFDECSSQARVKIMRHRNQALENFNENIAETGSPRKLQSVNGTDFTNKSFKHFCTNKKVKRN